MKPSSFFLQRAISCDADWHVSYPALCMASSTDPVDERRKQIVAAAADDERIRMVFFSSLGAILDFEASWSELDATTRGWLEFTTRWNRWWLPDRASLTAIERHVTAPTDVRFAGGTAPGMPSDTAAFRSYLNAVEAHYRRDEAISRVLFAPDAAFAA